MSQVTVQEVIDALCFRPDTYISAPFESLADRIRTHGIAPPEGMELVPIEPTVEMLKAGARHLPQSIGEERMALLYRAMLPSAPKPAREPCRRKLAPGQYWAFCGETDMGQGEPALCKECGGEFTLATKAAPALLAAGWLPAPFREDVE